MRIVTVLGARPQFVKAAPVSRAIAMNPDIEEILIHTGQHFDENMSAVFFEELELKTPEYNLDIHSLSHGAMTGRMLEQIEHLLLKIKPDVVLVYGDTDSTLAGALAAVKLHIPVAHVEAGLRAYDLSIPEEVNRVMTDHVSAFLFTPTETANHNLQKEGIAADKVFHVGDVMYDAMLHFLDVAVQRSRVLETDTLTPGAYILATLHRPVNTDQPAALKQVCDILGSLSRSYHKVVLPLHPRMKLRLEEFNLRLPDEVQILEPQGFLDMLMLEKYAALIVTDSGGVQKEAWFHRVPCVTLKTGTEWVELVEHGWNVVVPPDGNPAEIAAQIAARIGVIGDEVDLYGNGDASLRIADILSKHFPA